MDSHDSLEVTDVDRLTRQLRLMNDFQAEIQAGCWELQPGADHIFWSDTMFSLHQIDINPENLIAVEEAEQFIYEPDRALVAQKREELDQFGYAEYYLRINTATQQTRRIYAREKRVVLNGEVLYQGIWQDEAGQRELQRPLAEQNQKLTRQLKIFERAEQVGDTGSWQVNLETYETFYSDNLYRIHGLVPLSVSPHVDSFRKYIHPEDKAVVLRTQEKAYVEMIPLHLEYRIIRDDGEVRHLSQVSHLLRNEKGEHILAGSTRDITEQKVLEIQLTEANDILTLQNELFMEAEKIGKLGTWQVNIETRKVLYSANLYRIYGLKPYLVPAGLENFIHFIHPDDRELMRNSYSNAFTENILPDLTYRITRADGKPRILAQKSRFIKDSEGQLMLIGIVQDITEQQSQEKQLRETNEKLEVQHELFRHSEKIASIGSWTWNLDTDEIFYSDNVYTIYGLKPQSVPPGFANFGKYIHPDDRERMKEIPAKIREGREPITVEYRIIRPDGQLRYLRGRNQPITTVNGQTIVIGATQDVTEEVLMQQQLMDRIRFAEVLQEAMPDRIIVTDSANNVISWNKSCENFYKAKKEEVIGKNFFDVRPEAKVPEVLERFKRSLQGETIHMPVVSIPQVPGIFELLMVPFRNEAGNVVGVLHVLHDITQQQHLQHQLAARLEFIEKLQEASVDRIVVLDADLYFQLWNLQCEKFYGLSKDQVIGRHILEVFPHFKSDPLYRYCVRALEGETVYMPANDKEEFAVYQDSYFIPLKNDVKEITGILWIMHDLTERFVAEERKKQAEKILAKQQELLRQAEQIAHIGSWELDLDANKMYWSNEIFRMYGYEPQAFEPTMDFYIGTAAVEEQQQLKNAVAAAKAGREQELHCSILTVDGDTRYIQTKIRPITDQHERITSIIATMQDVTEQKMLESELNKKSKAMRLQFQLDRHTEKIKNIASWQWKTGTGKMIWGHHLFRLLGLKPYAVEQAVESFVALAHPEDRSKLATYFNDISLSQPGILPEEEVRMIIKDQVRYMRFSGAVISNGVVGSVLDVTEDTMLRKQLAERVQFIETLNKTLEDRNRKLNEINEELGAFAFVASHDLREPLRKIQIFADWLVKKESDRLSPEGKDRFNRIQAAVHRMDLLIDDILSFSHINTVEKKFTDVDLNEVLSSVKNDLSELISNTNAVIESDNLPVVHGSFIQCAQLFQNLIGNALKYQPPGNTPHVSIRAERVQGNFIDHESAKRELDYFKVTFADNGIGFDDQYVKKIFQMFQRLHGMNDYPGTGMGLAICKKIVEYHDGFITARGNPGHGAIFECYFPVQQVEAPNQ
jgi:PAS domain S-box-containing protein